MLSLKSCWLKKKVGQKLSGPKKVKLNIKLGQNKCWGQLHSIQSKYSEYWKSKIITLHYYRIQALHRHLYLFLKPQYKQVF